MAISSRLASRSTGSTLSFTKLILLNRSPPMVAATRYLVARSFRTTPPNYPDEEFVKRTLEYYKVLESTKHPFIREGPPSPVCFEMQGDKAYTRIDMPGVGKEGLKLWAEKNYFVFQGVESIDEDDEEVKKRVYSDRLLIDPANVFEDGINFVIQNGVLRIAFRLINPCIHPAY
ncbi:uncharacterized protein LOC132285203 [Cornus florida]|uniref:uncharacterized protein LOC132285203 n=1 Tax=Cornus florida TaxID=4283 RepID=UPI002896C7F6|nr:uncharacterized protein LOC132285203 [Cornus florida]